MKTQEERVQECLRIRHQWTEQIPGPVPDDIVHQMNLFVRDGLPSSGVTTYMGKTMFYQFSTKAETYISLRGGGTR